MAVSWPLSNATKWQQNMGNKDLVEDEPESSNAKEK